MTPAILNYFREHFNGCAAIEIKATDKNTIPYSALMPHQEAALRAASKGGKGLCYKISDAAHIRLPFDAFMLKGVPAFVVAAFIKHGIALAIPVEQWQGAHLRTACAFRIPL